MKILQLAPQFPFPETDGGKIGIASTFRQLAMKADVTFFCFSLSEPPKELLKNAEKIGKIILYKHSTKNTLPLILKSLFQKEPLYLTKHYSDEIFNYLLKLAKVEQFDIIHADHTAMAPIAIRLQEALGIPAGIRLHNVEHLIWKRYLSRLSKFDPKKVYISNQTRKLLRREAELIGKASVSFPITNEDAELAKHISLNANIVVAGPGINLDNWKRIDSEKKVTTLIHATTYDWIHNIEAIRWFLNEVMPGLAIINPEIRLQLLGKNPPAEFHFCKNTDVLGFVPSVIPYMSAAGIYIAPLFVGGGIRIKILEAMAMELPVIASPVSAEGIKAGENEGLIIARNKEDYLRHIKYLTNNPQEALKLGWAARSYILENYTWEKSIGIIYNSYQNLING
ncbi:MAG: glycosyltransferase [Candidatus Kapabacteria bacterium]|nr:glycosyltransferase [Ignavibacteriota bacterium]MCW5885230.1 glycosyltransferase [Candidatus Kapabacteria bacterium]